MHHRDQLSVLDAVRVSGLTRSVVGRFGPLLGPLAYSLQWLRHACKVATQRKVGPDRRLLDNNPTDDLELPEPGGQARHAYTDDECKALPKVAHGVHDVLPTLLTLAIHTGQRPTALCSLRWSEWEQSRSSSNSVHDSGARRPPIE